MERVRSGATQVLVNVEIVTEGFDVPEVEAIVLVRPTMSRALHVQMMGRGLRVAPGKVRGFTFAA
jgi:superfamily II DNA or RNA helicase